MITRIIHTETKDGKFRIDSHFAISMRSVNRYVNDCNHVMTTSKLVYSLSSFGGLDNCKAYVQEFSNYPVTSFIGFGEISCDNESDDCYDELER